MTGLIGIFLIGVVIGYLINKITSLLALILIVLIVVGYFLPGAHSNIFYHFLSEMFVFVKSQMIDNKSAFLEHSSLSKFIDFKNLSMIVFLIGLVVGFKIG
ncbi:hypothetical protein [Hydrogenobaculum acidophilum]